MDYQYEQYNQLRVAWTRGLDGGGRGFGQQIVPVVEKLAGKIGRVHELCAGPGFMGFSLLAHGLCDSLCLSDINPLAVAAIEHTVAVNHLEDRVSVYLSDALDAIPSHEQWDLVVSNPPHFQQPRSGPWGLILNDPDWSLHRRFYAGVRSHLTPHGQCFMQENYQGSRESTFLPFLQDSGLEYVGSLMLARPLQASPQVTPLNSFYFFVTRVKHEELVWDNASAAVDIDVVLDGSPCTISVNRVTAPETPLTLPLGRKYRVALSNKRAAPAKVTISSASRSSPYEIAPASTFPDWQVFLPMDPTHIADTTSGHAIIAFE